MCMLAVVSAAHAQTTMPATQPSPHVWRVLLVTFGPGDEPYEQFGHDAICLFDASTGKGVAYDYGRFDFDQPNFIGRFLRGRMLYSMGADDPLEMIAQYGSMADRDVWIQELNLSPPQVERLAALLEENYLPQNRNYRYDYYTANCTTKVRDAIDAAVDGQLKRQLSSHMTDKTYRWHTRTMMQRFRIYTAGLDLGMAQPTDVKLSAWAEAFLPHVLQEHLRSVTVLDDSGKTAPLVLNERQVHVSKTRPPTPTTAPRWTAAFLLIGVAIGAVMLVLTRYRWRWTFTLMAIAWCLAVSLAAAFMICLRVFTDHEAGYRNENLFLFEPVSLVLLVMIPLAIIRRRAVNATTMLCLAVLSIALLGLLVKPLPWFYQDTWWMMALALPVHAALAGSMIVWRHRLLAASSLGTQDDREPAAGAPTRPRAAARATRTPGATRAPA